MKTPFLLADKYQVTEQSGKGAVWSRRALLSPQNASR